MVLVVDDVCACPLVVRGVEEDDEGRVSTVHTCPKCGSGWVRASELTLHPTGRCGCAGEGRCQWCLLIRTAEERDDALVRFAKSEEFLEEQCRISALNADERDAEAELRRMSAEAELRRMSAEVDTSEAARKEAEGRLRDILAECEWVAANGRDRAPAALGRIAVECRNALAPRHPQESAPTPEDVRRVLSYLVKHEGAGHVEVGVAASLAPYAHPAPPTPEVD